MKDFIENRTVALVGNAQSLFNSQFGSDINDHDVVIRINNPAIFYDNLPYRNSHGTKIDVWAFWDEYRFSTSQSSCRTKRMDDYFYRGKYHLLDLKMGNRERGFSFNDKEQGADIKTRCMKETGNPSAGLICLYLLNEMNPKTVNVYGFDFKRTNTFHHTYKDVDENRYDSFYRHDYKFEEQYAQNKFFSQERFNLKRSGVDG